MIFTETFDVKSKIRKDAKTKKSNNWASKLQNIALGQLLQFLETKASMRGRKLFHLDTYYPSSKTCSCCGNKNEKLTLEDRVWVCPKCSTMLDRDKNAARNLLLQGESILHSKERIFEFSKAVTVSEKKKKWLFKQPQQGSERPFVETEALAS
jgi:transposase